MRNSSLQLLGALPRHDLIASVARLDEAECAALLHDWPMWARPNQLAPPGDWLTWLVLAGRGFGKTRVGSEWVRGKVAAGTAGRIALVAKDPSEARNVMVNGDSGLLAIAAPGERPTYQPSLKRLEWNNGAQAFIYSSEDFDELRGPQHDLAWVDELFKFRNQIETWDQLMFGLRLGKSPQVCITSTPAPTKLLRQLMQAKNTVVTRGSTYDNIGNLAPPFRSIIEKYEGTRLGRQELHAEVLDDIQGALWSSHIIEAARVQVVPCRLKRVVVAIDPAATSNEDSDETGIVVVGFGEDGHGYVLQDASVKARPEGWAKVAIDLYRLHHADRIIGETNNGGEMIEAVLRAVDRNIPYRSVHASRGKTARAEPISALYEQGKIHHVGLFAKLEDQMCSYDPLRGDRKTSPDRMDALVWGLSEFFAPVAHQGIRDYYESLHREAQASA